MKWTYLLVNLCSVTVPFIFSFHPKIKFNEKFFAFIKANIAITILFLIWDAIFTAKGIWSFNPDYTLGLNIYNLPLEELLFFVCIPFSCLFTYHCSTIFLKIQWNQKTEFYFILCFSLILLLTGIIYLDKSYTAVTCISTAILLLTIKFYFKVEWLSQLFSVYGVLLIPFFIVNGILTGTGLEEPVVLYNNAENLGIRLLTIPIEDAVYGFELILLNIFLYQRFLVSAD